MSIFIAMDLSPVHIYFKFEICPRSNQVTLNHSAPKVVQLEWTTCLGAFVRQAFQHDSLDLRYLKKNLRTPAARLRIGIRIKVGAGHPWSQLVTAYAKICQATSDDVRTAGGETTCRPSWWRQSPLPSTISPSTANQLSNTFVEF